MKKEQKCVYRRCENIPGKNGFFCDYHLEPFLEDELVIVLKELLTPIKKYERIGNQKKSI